MTLHVHNLSGCSPTPLAHYLKAIGILRLVAEQADATARGWWREESFSLLSRLTREELVQFFLSAYQPTPLVAPWNGGSGFFPKDKKDGIDALASSLAPRFEAYRKGIAAGRQSAGGVSESPKDEEKAKLLAECRRRWRGPLLDWLNAAVVLGEGGDPAYPALLGTGGNDGRLDFTNNFMQRLAELFDCRDPQGAARPGVRDLLEAALLDERQRGLQSVSVGQFLPGGAGGANSSVGFGGGALVNPWDFVLMLEGAVAFASGVARRMTAESLPQAAAPFAVYSSPTGFASGVDGEKSRGEQWMPLWERPMSYREFVALLAEGRCQLRDRPAQRPLDMARAIARLGVARGIAAFERYGYIERNGQSNLATPLGRWRVPESPPPFQELLDEIEGWVDRLRRKGGGKGAPAAISRAARRCEDAMLNCCREGHVPARWQELLVRLGEAEAQLVRSPGFTASAGLQPLGAYGHGLSPQWLAAAAADSPELRLALALAAAHGTRRRRDASAAEDGLVWDRADPVRRHFLPLERPGERSPSSWRPRRFAVAGEKLAADPAVVCLTGDFERDAVAVVQRRIVEAQHSLSDFLPLAAVPGSEASLVDLQDFLSGRLNSAEILALARPLMALDWTQFERQRNIVRERLRVPAASQEPAAADALGLHGLFRLCHHWGPVPVPGDASRDQGTDDGAGAHLDREVRLAPSIYTRLAHGDLATAIKLAVRRLNASGLRPHVTVGVGDQAYARRLAAALVFPVGNRNAGRLARRLLRPHLRATDREPSEPLVEPAVDAPADR